MAAPPAKRKRVVLTVDDKLKVLDGLADGASLAAMAQQFGVGRSTISDIKKQATALRAHKQQIVEMGMKRDSKVIRLGNFQELEKALYIWFCQKRSEGVQVSGPLLCEKASALAKVIYGDATTFQAKDGWKWRFVQRHGIHCLAEHGEKESADRPEADDFVTTFRQFVKDENLTSEMLFNCDETGLNFRLLPRKTLATAAEKNVSGTKLSKERVTLNVCSNAAGTCKIPLQMIGKSQRPRCFRNVQPDLIPVDYTGQKSAWMTTAIFIKWFHETVVPKVREHMTSIGVVPARACLLLDNCPAHPNSEELVSDDGLIFAKYLPPYVTSLIQPMDQGVIQTIKMRYKHKLLRKLVIEEEAGMSPKDFIKGIDLRVTADLVGEAWSEVSPTTLQRSWRKIIPDVESADGPVDAPEPPSGEIQHEVEQMLTTLGSSDPVQAAAEYLEADEGDPGYQLMTDEEICQSVMPQSVSEVGESDAESEDEVQLVHQPAVSHSAAADMLDKSILWLEEQPEATAAQLAVLRQLRALACRKRMSSLQQRSIADFFAS